MSDDGIQVVRPTIKLVHKAIRNYLVNELKLDHNAVFKVVQDIARDWIVTWFNAQMAEKNSFLRKLLVERLSYHAEMHLKQNLAVALSKVECRAEIVILDGRMNDT